LAGFRGEMRTLFLSWGISAAVLILVAIALGLRLNRGYLGILIDNRGRYSLTQMQVVLWSILIISLIVGLYSARVVANISDALNFAIPEELLIVMGISVGSTAVAITVKAGKDASHPGQVAASNESDRPRFAQMFLVEEGELADKVVDVTKFQNFWITVILVAAYIVLAVNAVDAADRVDDVVLPGFSGTFLTLLGISHAGYLAGKLPNQPGKPKGLTVLLRRGDAVPGAAAAPAPSPATYTPRNP
jgi:hypothetical protein